MNRRGLFHALLGFPVAALIGSQARAALPDWPDIEVEPVPPGPYIPPEVDSFGAQPFLGEVRAAFSHYMPGRSVNGELIVGSMHTHTIHMADLPPHNHAYAQQPVAILQYEQWNGTKWVRIDQLPYEQPPLEVACGNRIED